MRGTVSLAKGVHLLLFVDKDQRRLKFSLVCPNEPHDRGALPTAVNRASDLSLGLEPKEG